MNKREKIEKKWNSLLYNHLWLKYIVDYGISLIITVLSAAIFAFGLNVFITPSLLGVGNTAIVSGGSSGVAQVIKALLEMVGVLDSSNEVLEKVIYYVLYGLVNVPLLFLAYFGVGKRFGIFTILNVALVILFGLVFNGSFFYDVAITFSDENGYMLARALFAGVCTGLSSALAFKIESSAGGFDIVSYYVSNKKSTLAGKYNLIINGGIMFTYAILTAIRTSSGASALVGILYSFVYLLTVMLVIDVINVRNKKAQIQIITTQKNLPKLLIANIPHGATLVDARGVYSDTERYIIYMVVSTTEVKRAVKVIKQLDPESFVNISALQQVYGNFHQRPVK